MGWTRLQPTLRSSKINTMVGVLGGVGHEGGGTHIYVDRAAPVPELGVGMNTRV